MYHNEQFEIFVQVSMDYIRCLKIVVGFVYGQADRVVIS